MKCKICNYENADGSLFCNKCGERIGTELTQAGQNVNGEIKESKKDKGKIKKVCLISGICLGIIILIVIITFVIRGSYAKQVIGYIDKGEVTKAQEIFTTKVKNNTKYEEELKGLIIVESEKIIRTYVDGEVTYDDAQKELASIYQFEVADPSQKQKSLTYILNLKSSREQFDKGNELITSNPEQAIACLEKVIKEDDNYNKAQELLQQATKNYESQELNKIKKLGEENNYEEALKKIETVSKTLQNNAELDELQSKYRESLNQKILSEAEQLIQGKKYEEAKMLLTKNQNYELKGAMSEKLAEIEKLKEDTAKERIKAIKQRVSVVYDEVDKDYTIVPKGYSSKYNNISRATNIELRVVMDTTPTLMMITGFVNEDWIFMKRITFACDDKREEIQLEYFDRGSQVLGGGDIAEWYAFMHTDLGIETSQIRDLEPLIKDIINSEKSSIRFSGDSYIDHVITSKETQALKDIWEVYTILEEYPSMLALIK